MDTNQPEIEVRTCTKCGQTKLISEYNWVNKTKGKHHSRCRECTKQRSKESYRKNYPTQRKQIRERNKSWDEKNKEWRKNYRRQYYLDNREHEIELQKQYKSTHRKESADAARKRRAKDQGKANEYSRNRRKQNRDRCLSQERQYREKNKDKILIYRREYHTKNRDRVNAKISTRRKKRERTDPAFRLLRILRNRLRDALAGQGVRKASRTLDLLGCDALFFKQYLESLWQPGMSWDNHGLKGWHIDHIRPCASFDLTDPEQQKQCFHYTNLQPLWAADNMLKRDRLDWNPTNNDKITDNAGSLPDGPGTLG